MKLRRPSDLELHLFLVALAAVSATLALFIAALDAEAAVRTMAWKHGIVALAAIVFVPFGFALAVRRRAPETQTVHLPEGSRQTLQVERANPSCSIQPAVAAGCRATLRRHST